MRFTGLTTGTLHAKKVKPRVERSMRTKTTQRVDPPAEPIVSYVGSLGTTVGSGATLLLVLNASTTCVGSIMIAVLDCSFFVDGLVVL